MAQFRSTQNCDPESHCFLNIADLRIDDVTIEEDAGQSISPVPGLVAEDDDTRDARCTKDQLEENKEQERGEETSVVTSGMKPLREDQCDE